MAWAKSPNKRGVGSSGWLSLVDHSIDVTAVAEALLRMPTIRARLSSLAGRVLGDIDVARLGFFTGLHDAGKVNRGFQARLRNENPNCGHIGPLWSLLKCPHFDRSHQKLQKEVRGALMKSRSSAWFGGIASERELWGVILAHHGSLPADAPHVKGRIWRQTDEYDPIAELHRLATVVSQMVPAAFDDDGRTVPDRPRFQHALAGFVTLADWLGSDDTVFRPSAADVPSGRARIPWSRRLATRLVNRRGIDPSDGRLAARQQPNDFVELFPGYDDPRPAQAELLRASLPEPGQVIVLEAETGSGKTEAALIHFLRLFQAGEVDGLYFALPTRAAAVQIHGRIHGMVRRWLGCAAPPVGLAVPGYLQVDDAKRGIRLPDQYAVLWPDEVQDRGWAVENPKRYLSGTVMVGTIDQLLMGGIRVQHAPLRSGPMLRLLLCVDEVHASDAYMTTLLRNVLNQHLKAGGHALLMSATLGSQARVRFMRDRVEPHHELDAGTAAALPFPSLQRFGENLTALPSSGRVRRKTVAVELLNPETSEGTLLADLKSAALNGAVVLFIRNRVDDAVEATRQLEGINAPLLRCRGVVAPHHSRFSPGDRRLLDAALAAAFRRPGGIIAVTTQTAEQSLDIDADWLVADIAPGDVLLQRIGRLHRHDLTRPAGFETARATVLAPTHRQIGETLSHQGEVHGQTILGLGRVYENVVGVLATRKWLERGRIQIPADNRALVEAATNHVALTDLAERLGNPWDLHLENFECAVMANSQAARTVCVEWDRPFADNQPVRDLDDRAVTRLGLKDRIVDLPDGISGPFGRPVQTVPIPGWMMPDEPLEDRVRNAEVQDGEIRFCLGSKRFRYDRFGLSTS